MYRLSEFEINSLKEYSTLDLENENSMRSNISSLNGVLDTFIKEYCYRKYDGLEVGGVFEGTDIMWKTEDRFVVERFAEDKARLVGHFQEFKNNCDRLRRLRNTASEHKKRESLLTLNMVKSANDYLLYCLRWYFEKGMEVSKNDIEETNIKAVQDALEKIFSIGEENTDFFDLGGFQEKLLEREKHYVLFLIDSSSSMIFFSLKDKKYFNDEKSEQYQKAKKSLIDTISSAHQQTLNALRGSLTCRQRAMEVYQYTFNATSNVLNEPRKLSPLGLEDKVVLIDSNNYEPFSVTALYQTLEEALGNIYTNYLKKNKDKFKRIDKLSIGIITDGEDTYIDNTLIYNEKELYETKKKAKLKKIKEWLKMLRGNGDLSQNHLEGSVVIGLTGEHFSKEKLEVIRKEIGFEEAISISDSNEKSIRRAFKTASTGALNI